jgi:hypothetical protein
VNTYNQTHDVKAYLKAYHQTPERKAARKSYDQSPEGRARTQSFNQSTKGKARSQRYDQTPERQAYRKAWMKEWAQSPEGKASIAARKQSPEGRFKDSEKAARRRKLEFSIPELFHAELIQQPCHYCHGRLSPTGCGMDRMDSSKGYFIGNVVPCCGDCNTMKSDKLSYDEMMLVWDYRRK